MFESKPNPEDGAEFDDLADLFLGPDEPAATTDGEEERPACATAPGRITALLLGHLPVMAGPWAAQFVAAEAGRLAAPVGLARLFDAWASVEVFGVGAGGREVCATTFEKGVEQARSMASRWFVRVDAPEEMAVVRSGGVDSVVVLTGADDGAVVAAYRLLKAAAGAMAPGSGDEPRLAVAVVGATPERAEVAAVRLRETLAAHTGIDLVVLAPIERMDVVSSGHVFEGRFERNAVSAVDLLSRGGSGGRDAAPLPAAEPVAPEPLSGGGEKNVGIQPPRDFGEPRAYSGVSVNWATATPPSVQHDIHAERRRPDVLLRAAPAPPHEPGAALTALIRGLSPLTARCPYEPHIELALDETGGLHAITESGPRALEALEISARWAREHAGVLALTAAGKAVNGARAVTKRLIARDPASVVRLLGADVRVHVRTMAAAADGSAVEVCVELN